MPPIGKGWGVNFTPPHPPSAPELIRGLNYALHLAYLLYALTLFFTPNGWNHALTLKIITQSIIFVKNPVFHTSN
jgi:hypothetical protein